MNAAEGCVNVFASSKVEISGGEFTATDNGVIMTNGSSAIKDCNYDITITGGTFNGQIKTNGYIACGIYMANTGTVNLKGGTFNITGGIGVLVRCGTLNATGGTITLNNKNGLTSGKVGDKATMIEVGTQIVKDETNPPYPGATPKVEKNTPNFSVKTISSSNSEG